MKKYQYQYRYHYTYLITNLEPTSDLQFYIGVKSCNCLPCENTDYMGSSHILIEDIKLHGVDNFEKIIIAEFSSRDEAEIHENALHEGHNAALNPIFYNKKNGTIGWHTTDESIAKQKETKADPRWKETKGKEAKRKRHKTKSDPSWKATTGVASKQKLSRTQNDPAWKETVGKEKKLKEKTTKARPNWQETVGKAAAEKRNATITNPDWIRKIHLRVNLVIKL